MVVAIGCIATPTAAAQDHLSQPRYDESVTETVKVPTPWGTIFGKVRRPVVPDGTRVPVILEYTPYSAPLGGGSYADDAVGDFYVPRGYGRAVFDVPGTNNSTGCWDFGGPRERRAGLAVIDYLRGLPWVKDIGLYGYSYPGATAVMLSGAARGKIGAVFAGAPPDRWYDYDFQNGVRTPYMVTPFPLFFPVLTTVTGVGADDPGTLTENTASRLQMCNSIEMLLQSNSFDPQYTDFWRQRDYRRYAATDVKAPTLVLTGLQDNDVKHAGVIDYFHALPDSLPKRLFLVQNGHALEIPDEVEEAVHAWFDEHLLGRQVGPAPRVVTTDNRGRQRTGRTWPPATTGHVRYRFGDQLEREGDDTGWDNSDKTLCDDRTLMPTAPGGGVGVSGRVPVCGLDQATGPSPNGTYVRWISRPLGADTEIAGRPEVDLTLRSSGDRAQLAVTLFDIDPDGKATVLTNGFMSSRAREGIERSVPIVPGEPWTARFGLWDIDTIVPAGHRIAVSLAANNSQFTVPTTDSPGQQTTSLDEGDSTLDLPVYGTAPRPKACRGRTRFIIRLPRNWVSATVRLAKRKLAVRRRRGRLVATVDLRGHRRARVRLVARGRTRTGARRVQRRTYRLCH